MRLSSKDPATKSSDSCNFDGQVKSNVLYGDILTFSFAMISGKNNTSYFIMTVLMGGGGTWRPPPSDEIMYSGIVLPPLTDMYLIMPSLQIVTLI